MNMLSSKYKGNRVHSGWIDTGCYTCGKRGNIGRDWLDRSLNNKSAEGTSHVLCTTKRVSNTNISLYST